MTDTDRTNTTASAQVAEKPTKAKKVTDLLRARIVARMKPESRLSSYPELEREFGVSRGVVREAINQLKREGFIYSLDRRGMYVSDRSPHLSRFGIVFADNPSSRQWPRFYTALQNEADALARERNDLRFSFYHDIARGPGTQGYQRLAADARAHRLAGVLLAPCCHAICHNSRLIPDSVPRMYICGWPQTGHVPSASVDSRHMMDRMVQWLRANNRKRIAVLVMWGNHEFPRRWLEQYGIPHRPSWYQVAGRDNVYAVRYIISLLMDYPVNERPDGLIIIDDNITEHAIAGLLECGIRIGEDIDVIAHCNWPWPVPSSVPIQRVGFHARHVIEAAICGIRAMRAGQRLPANETRVPALFENEIDKPVELAPFGLPLVMSTK